MKMPEHIKILINNDCFLIFSHDLYTIEIDKRCETEAKLISCVVFLQMRTKVNHIPVQDSGGFISRIRPDGGQSFFTSGLWG